VPMKIPGNFFVIKNLSISLFLKILKMMTPSASAIKTMFPDLDGTTLWLRNPSHRISTLRSLSSENCCYAEMPYRVYCDLLTASFKEEDNKYKPFLEKYKKGMLRKLETRIADTNKGFNRGYNFVDEMC